MKRILPLLMATFVLFSLVSCSRDVAKDTDQSVATGAESNATGTNGSADITTDKAKDIPKLYFTGDMSHMTGKKDVRDISFEYISKQQETTGAAKIKLQGASSLSYDKKNFTINFYKDENYLEEIGIDVGWGLQNEYCLKANWIDKTHSRNVVTAKIAGEIQKKIRIVKRCSE